MNTFDSIKLSVASPDDILKNSHGEITKPETINYRTQKPEKDGLFDERIFGPVKDWECYCGKYRRIRYKGVVCDKCGVEVTRAIVRRERMGHIKMAVPVAHIWFLRSIPSKIGLMLDVPLNALERVIYYAAYIIVSVDEKARDEAFEEINREYKQRLKQQTTHSISSGQAGNKRPIRQAQGKQKASADSDFEALTKAKDKARDEVKGLTKYKVLSENEFHELSAKYGHIFEAGIGGEAVKKLLEEINLKELVNKLADEEKTAPLSTRKKFLKRLKLVRSMLQSGMRPEWMFLTILPVLPPDLRPMVPLDGGRYATSDLNDLYRRVINRNNRLKKLMEFNAPEVIVRNEKRMLQEAVDALIDNSARHTQSQAAALVSQKRPLRSLADMLKGKQGRFRQNLLGKRVDYSGRSVIVVGPELSLDECGLPKQMALELFKPFVINKIIERELAHNIKGANRLIEEGADDIWEILEEVIKNKYVLLNRAPTLHRLGIQAFKPVLVEGLAIQIHPMVCAAFNADFDGDQMAVHLPLSQEAQREAREIMLSSRNLLKPATGESIATPTNEMILGVYYLSKLKDGLKGEGKVFGNEQEAVLTYQFGEVDLQAKIKVRIPSSKLRALSSKLVETSVGRILINQILPENFEFINENLKSKDVRAIVGRIFTDYGIGETAKVLDRIKKLGFEYATKSGISWGMDDLVIPEEKGKVVEEAKKQIEVVANHYGRGLLTGEEKEDKDIEIWKAMMDKIEKLVQASLDPNSSVFSIVDSKARGSWKQLTQMMGLKGLVQNPAGDIIDLPILSSFKEGFNVLEYFISTHGARKGSADTALRTASAGYLTRRLVDVSQDVVITENDCGDNVGFLIKRKDSEEFGLRLGEKIFSRIIVNDIADSSGKVIIKSGEVIDRKKGELINKEEISEVVVRSPITCRAKFGICQKCYGYDLGNNQLAPIGMASGIIAAQAIGEPGTQLTMRTFHTGGVAMSSDITAGLPRVQEIFEARIPKGKAIICEVEGKVIDIIDKGKTKVIKISTATKADGKKGEEVIEYSAAGGSSFWVSKGDLVTRGQQLSEGSLDLKELFGTSGRQAVASYILNEIQKVYADSGSDINSKHIEVIIRQMFGRLRIKDAGDTNFTIGDVVEKITFAEENSRVKKAIGRPATAVQLMMGITKVALTTESFLSAASFQETAKVLINASTEGKSDKLRGLKENVILGRLIPAGTGYRKRV